MRIKKLLALLLAAAMALTLFAGCDGDSVSLRQLLLALLQGQYQNVTITAGPAMSDILRQAVTQGDTQDEVDDALQDALQPTVPFDSLWNATSEDNAFDLAYYSGTDAQAIAHQVYTDWNKALNTLPSGSRYVADFAAFQADGGYYVLMSVAGGDSHSVANSDAGSVYPDDDTSVSEGIKPEEDPDEEPEENHGDRGEKQFNGFKRLADGYTYVVENSEGLNNLLFNDKTDFWLNLDRDGGLDDNNTKHDGNFVGVTIELAASGEPYILNQQIETFRGTLTSAASGSKAAINVSHGYSVIRYLGGEVSNIDFTVTDDIQTGHEDFIGFAAGAVAEQSGGTISGCNVSFNGHKINVSSSDFYIYVGGIVGYNTGEGTIKNCKVTGADIKVGVLQGMYVGIYVGGIEGNNPGNPGVEKVGILDHCQIENSTIQVNISEKASLYGPAAVGGIVGNVGKGGQLINCTPPNISVSVNYKEQCYTPATNEASMKYGIAVGNTAGVGPDGLPM